MAVHRLRGALELEALAHDAGKKAAHRVLLPAGGRHHRFDRCAWRRLQHRDDTRLLRASVGLVSLAISSVWRRLCRSHRRWARHSWSLLCRFGHEILRRAAPAAAPPKPRHGDRAGGVGSRSALGARKLTTVPLQSERIASHFSTMSLRGSATFDRRIKADGTTAAVLVRVRRVGATFAPARRARACNIVAVTETGSIELRAWHGVRVLSAPPRILPLTEISRFSATSAELAGVIQRDVVSATVSLTLSKPF